MNRNQTYGIVFIIILSLLMFFLHVGGVDFSDTIESRRLLIAEEMVTTGDWLIPTLGGSIIVTKPPLFYWLTALVMRISGSTAEWTVRLPSAMGGMLCLLVLYGLGINLNQSSQRLNPLFLPLILGTTLLFRGCARLGEPDMLMTSFTTAGMLFYWRFQQNKDKYAGICFFIAIGLSLFAKGPFGLLIIVLTILAYSIITRSFNLIRALPWFTGLIVIMLIFIPWIIITYRVCPDFFRIITSETMGRITGEVGSHEKEFMYYIKKFDGNYYPWSLFIFGAILFGVVQLLRNVYKRQRIKIHIDTALLFALLWTISSFIVLSMITSKRFYYGVIAGPPVALLTYLIADKLYNKYMSPLKSRIRYISLIPGILLLIGCLFIPMQETVPRLDGEHFPPSLYVILTLSVVCIVCGLFFKRNIIESIVVGLSGITLVILIWHSLFKLDAINRQRSPREAVSQMIQYQEEHTITRIAEYDELNHAVHYYLGYRPLVLSGTEDLKKMYNGKKSISSTLILTTKEHWDKIPPDYKKKCKVIYSSPRDFYPRKKRLIVFLFL